MTGTYAARRKEPQPSAPVMQFYNNVARLRQFLGANSRQKNVASAKTGTLAAAAAIDLSELPIGLRAVISLKVNPIKPLFRIQFSILAETTVGEAR